jgi:hypothetical protein
MSEHNHLQTHGNCDLHFYVDVNVLTPTFNYCITPLLCLLHIEDVNVSTY